MYQCDKCGACCVQIIVEITDLDVLREPKLALAAEPFRIPEGMELEEPELVPGFGAGAMLACGTKHPCALLGPDKSCTIYPTRPNVCVAFQAGSELCQQARGMAGLPPLQESQND